MIQENTFPEADDLGEVILRLLKWYIKNKINFNYTKFEMEETLYGIDKYLLSTPRCKPQCGT